MTSDAEIRALLDKQAITEVVYRFGRGVDRLDADIINSCFHPDGYDDHGFYRGVAHEFTGKLVRWLGRGTKKTSHLMGQVLIELDGDTAYAESYVVASHRMDRDGAEVDWVANGRYVDRFERRDGVWKIAHRRVVHDWDRTDPVVERSDESADTWNAGSRTKDDPSYNRAG